MTGEGWDNVVFGAGASGSGIMRSDASWGNAAATFLGHDVAEPLDWRRITVHTLGLDRGNAGP